MVDPAKFHEAFAADLPAEQSAVMAATQRPGAEARSRSLRTARLEVHAGVGRGRDRRQGGRLGRDPFDGGARRATITEVDASHFVMVSHPDVVADVIRTAAAASEAGP